MNLRLLLLPALVVVQPLLAIDPPGYDAEAGSKAQAWLFSLKEADLARSLTALQAARKGPVPVDLTSQECLAQVVASMAALHPDALSYPGSEAAFAYHAIIQPMLAENGFPAWQDLGATLIALGWMKAPEATTCTSSSSSSSSSTSSPVAARSDTPALPSSPAKAPATPGPAPKTLAPKTLASEGLTFVEALALIAALNPMLPDGTYDAPALSAHLATVAAHDIPLAATLMGHYRLEQDRLKAAVKR